MEQRLTIITLGVNDLNVSESFYSDTLKWEKHSSSSENIVFYNLNGLLLALYPLHLLAEDAKCKPEKLNFRGFTLAYNTRSKDEVDKLFAELREKGVEIAKAPENVFWGGYSGYFADPDNNLWEVAYNPYLKLGRNGKVTEETNSEIKISIAEMEDLGEILALQKEAYLQEAEIYNDFEIQPLHQTIDSIKEEWQCGIVLKATVGSGIIGSIRAYIKDKTCYIGKVVVNPVFQNRGIGKLLLNKIEEIFSNAHCYELFTGHESKKNLAFYQKNGYEVFKNETVNKKLKMVYLQKLRGRLQK